MSKYSKNKKLNTALCEIESDLIDNLGVNEIKRYFDEFPSEVDYNLAQYGNLLVYYDQIREFYKK